MWSPAKPGQSLAVIIGSVEETDVMVLGSVCRW
jgi:hypothetical protein